MTEERDTLVTTFKRHGYRAVAVMPGVWQAWPEGSFYGFDGLYGGPRLDYQGPPFGWWDMTDQFTLARSISSSSIHASVNSSVMSHHPNGGP